MIFDESVMYMKMPFLTRLLPDRWPVWKIWCIKEERAPRRHRAAAGRPLRSMSFSTSVLRPLVASDGSMGMIDL
jgi:hypothetical protein